MDFTSSSISVLKMAFSWHVFTLLLLHAFAVDCTFRYENCGTNNSIITLPEFRILPDPMDLNDKRLTVTVQGEILRNIPSSAELEVKYVRLRQLFGMQLEIPIPCIFGKYGSCTLPFCDYMDRFRTHICPFLQNDISCDCPPSPGNYSKENVEIELAETSAIGRFFAKGTYRTEMRLIDRETGKQLSCFILFAELT